MVPAGKVVRLMLLYTFTWYLASSIFSRSLLSVWIKKLTDSDETVGSVTGCQGLVQVIGAIPVAFVSDRFKREHSLRLALLVGIAAMALTMYCFYILRDGTHLTLLYVAFALQGLFTAIVNPNLESIFADAVSKGKRGEIFSIKHAVLQLGGTTGPLISIILFLTFGNEWQLSELRSILFIGCAFSVVPLSLLPFFRDEDAKGDDGDGEEEEDDGNVVKSGDHNILDDSSQVEAGLLMNEVGAASMSTSMSKSENEGADLEPFLLTDAPGSGKKGTRGCCGKKAAIRWIIATADFVTALAAGMSIKFFPLYFVDTKRGYSLSPVYLAAVYFSCPLMTAAFVWPASFATKHMGRPAVMIMMRGIGTAALFLIALGDQGEKNPLLMCALFIFRTAAMNSIAGIKRSMLMDATPKSARARWNSLESITRFSWSGSAFIGGYLVEQHGFRFCFLITAIMYAASTSMNIPLLYLTT
eukprot:g4267.t1